MQGVMAAMETSSCVRSVSSTHLQPWDLDRANGGVFVLPPYQKSSGSDWYTGTANAIYQNINFIDRYEPEYVLLLSGDHIYKMDYEKMLAYHKEKNADCTIAVLQVPMEEASRFGIMNTYPDGTIFEFEEKPPQPKSNLASMGLYIFTWEKLRKYLIEDEACLLYTSRIPREYLAITRRLPPLPTGTLAEGSIQVAALPTGDGGRANPSGARSRAAFPASGAARPPTGPSPEPSAPPRCS